MQEKQLSSQVAERGPKCQTQPYHIRARYMKSNPSLATPPLSQVTEMQFIAVSKSIRVEPFRGPQPSECLCTAQPLSASDPKAFVLLLKLLASPRALRTATTVLTASSSPTSVPRAMGNSCPVPWMEHTASCKWRRFADVYPRQVSEQLSSGCSTNIFVPISPQRYKWGCTVVKGHEYHCLTMASVLLWHSQRFFWKCLFNLYIQQGFDFFLFKLTRKSNPK